MSLSKRIVAALLVIILGVSALYAGNHMKEEEEKNVFDQTATIHIWYTDEALTDHLGSMAVKYNEQYGVRVIPVLQSGLELLENINKTSLSKENTPDLFIATNDIIEKAYLSGLAMPIDNSDGAVGLLNFPESAVHAVTYKQEIIGYPFYYETSALLYNKTYLEDLARKNIREELENQKAAEASEEKTEETTEGDTAKNKEEATEESTAENTIETAGENTAENTTETAGENTAENTEETIGENTAKNTEESSQITEISEEELERMVEERIPSLIPTTFEKLLEFADNYDAPENVEAVFKWDVADIFYNYFFVGNYINVGGMCGDNVEAFDIYNEDAIDALRVYQQLNDYFAIDAANVDYSSVIREFMEGKVVMTTATTDIVGKLKEAEENGEFSFEYGIATIPRLTEEMETKGMSVTNAIYVNGYSQMKEEANDFARFLTMENAGALYEATGKVTANKNILHENQNLNMFMKEYQDSAPIPKIMATSNLLIKMEIMFDKIWNGEDVSGQLKQLSEEMMTQITGLPYEEQYIQREEEQKEYIDYSQD